MINLGLEPVFAMWREVKRRMRLTYYRWALREMGASHPDLSEVMNKIADLENRR